MEAAANTAASKMAKTGEAAAVKRNEKKRDRRSRSLTRRYGRLNFILRLFCAVALINR
jgi:hypothetical protein